ncbi:MAG: enoyl-CoA hydratase-related protein, partial [Acidimicrobiales bacterium]
MTEEVLYDVSEGVARVTINRPERRNALAWGTVKRLRQALARARADAAVRVVVLTGAGDRAFCAGADLGGMAAGASFL